MIERVRTGLKLATVVLFVASSAAADDSLHARIDQMLEEANFGVVAPVASDGEFLRRLYLDLTGSIPPSDVARAFLDDPSPEKRVKMIDQLLNSPQYVRHMTNVFDVMLLERRGEKYGVKADEWRKFLFDSFAQNKPWNQLAKEILAADGTNEKVRAAAAFYLYRDAEPNLLTRDVGRVFFGVDLQCAQCHNHPLIDSYYQSDYYGIYAFLNRGFLFTDKDKKVFYAEKAEGDVSFTSVFTEEQDNTFPRLPGGFEIDEPFFPKGEEYSVAPANKVRPVPKYSRRAQLAALATNGENHQFNRNIANRLWALMLGRGLVEPVDLQHADNPPSNPELLELIADRFAAMHYDIKAFLRELALTKTYQRKLEPPQALAEQSQAAASQLAALSAESQSLEKALKEAVAKVEAAQQEFDAARDAVDPVYKELGAANKAIGEARKAAEAAAKALVDAQKQLAGKQDVAKALSDAAAATGAAADKLPNEKTLAEAAAKFKAKAEQLAKEVEAANKAVAEKTPPSKATAEALAATKAKAEAIKQRFDATRAKVRELEPKLAAALHARDADTRAKLLAGIKQQDAKALTEYNTLLTAKTTALAALDNSNRDLAANRQQLAAVTAELPKLKEAMAAAQQVNDKAASQLADTQSQLKTKQETAALVVDAAAKAAAAAGKLPKEANLNQAAESIKERADALNTEVAALQKVAAQHEAEAKAAAESLATAKQVVDKKTAELNALKTKQPSLETQVKELAAKSQAAQSQFEKTGHAIEDQWGERFFTSRLTPLTPEQIGWSVMEATGVIGQQRAAAVAEVDKKVPLDPKNPTEPARLAERNKQLEAFVFGKVKGNFGTFVKLFGHAGGQPQADFFATVDQALFFSNGGTVLSWLNPSGNNLTARLNKLEDPKAIAEEMYISVLTRRPTDQETADITQYLASRPKEKLNALKEMAWALITSAEFRFNH